MAAVHVTRRHHGRRLPRRVAVLGAAGGLGQGILSVCKAEGVQVTAIVRSRPNRIAEILSGSRVAVITSLADRPALTEAFAGADAVLTAIGLTSTSADRSALLSANMATIEESMLAAGVDRRRRCVDLRDGNLYALGARGEHADSDGACGEGRDAPHGVTP